mmetsp:Transcript_94544/g.294503  ORF Transcript_94544/g.294503 Transcript_94544/m.294503 type:complete len:223 (+) Transcript_94544:275-943(+)
MLEVHPERPRGHKVRLRVLLAHPPRALAHDERRAVQHELHHGDDQGEVGEIPPAALAILHELVPPQSHALQEGIARQDLARAARQLGSVEEGRDPDEEAALLRRKASLLRAAADEPSPEVEAAPLHRPVLRPGRSGLVGRVLATRAPVALLEEQHARQRFGLRQLRGEGRGAVGAVRDSHGDERRPVAERYAVHLRGLEAQGAPQGHLAGSGPCRHGPGEEP